MSDTGLLDAIEAAVKALGVCLGKRSRSTRHGFQPLASEHVRRYLLYEVLGVKASALAWSARVHKSTIYWSVAAGRKLCRENAKALGMTPPRRPREDD